MRDRKEVLNPGKESKMDLQLFADTDAYEPHIWGPTDEAPVMTTSIDSDRRDIDISEEIAYLLPDATPFLVVLMRAQKKPTATTEFRWFDKEPAAWWTQLEQDDDDDTGEGSSDTTKLIVEDASIFKEHDIVKNANTDEVMLVEDVDVGKGSLDAPAGEITVERGWGYASDHFDDGTQETDADENHWLMRMGNAMTEDSLSPSPRATQPEKHWNYVQTFRTSFSASNDASNEALKTSPDERNRLRQEKLIEHRLDIERAMLFGERMEAFNSGDDGEVRRTTGGLYQFIDTNSYDVGTSNEGVLTEAEFESFLEDGFKWKKATKEKLFVCSSKVGSVINQFAAGRIRTVSGDTTYGLQLNEYQSFHGRIYIATCESFEKEYDDMGMLLDIGNISYRPFAGEDSTLHTNIQENDRDGWKDEYMTKAGLEVRLEKTHAILTGVSA